ncbi:MAG TPA: DUF885 family protein [Streptosporangiaceae bacterium]|jgi:hypothetical protein
MGEEMRNDGPDDLGGRLRAVCDLMMSEAREGMGRHEYDGRVQDLSTAGVTAALARLGGGELADPHDEAHLSAFEESLRVAFGELALHRRNPLPHVDALDLACYDRTYAPEAERAKARAAHLRGWPEAADAAVATLDAVPAPVASALIGAVRGLAAALPADADPADLERARAAHTRLVAHVERIAAEGDPDISLGGPALARLMGSGEAMAVDLGRLAERADAERDRVTELLIRATARIDGSRPPLEVARELVRDHPDGDGVLAAARTTTAEAIAFTRDHDLVPYHDGVCEVGEAPESRRWAMAMMTWSGPWEADTPSYYHITPPDPSWPERDIEEWLEVFSASTLPAVTVHEVAPGHFSHGRALRRAPSAVRRALQSGSFIEGWAHYAEELCVEEGFRADDPRFAVGVWLEALVRITRLACAIGVHTGAMTVEDGARRFAADTHLSGPAALAEARRATYDPSYGRYTWGKLAIMDLRDRARQAWGAGYTHRRFHGALLDLGAPPLGLMATALERG